MQEYSYNIWSSIRRFIIRAMVISISCYLGSISRYLKSTMLYARYRILITISDSNQQNEYNLCVWYRVLFWKSFFFFICTMNFRYLSCDRDTLLLLRFRPSWQHGEAPPLIPLTARIIKHIPNAKSSEITHLVYLIYCFGNCKNIVIISDPQSTGL